MSDKKTEKVRKRYITSESVTEGHPDKLCDQISDAILDAILEKDKKARVACETMVTTGLVMIAGEITTSCYVEIPDIARGVVKRVGYTDAAYGFDYATCAVVTSIKQQSADIAMGVNGHKDIGAGDQGMMIGYACDETPELMPLPIMLAHKLVRRLAHERQTGKITWLRPDGKSQVTVEYIGDTPKRVTAVVLSAQHEPDVSYNDLKRELMEKVIKYVIPAEMLTSETVYHINPTGRFVIGGPHGDTGVTGRKIIVDTYGGVANHGGGCFSGKDPTKVDRSAAYAARWLAKNIVASGIARRAEIRLAYAIGVPQPVSIDLDTFGTAKVDEEKIVKAIRDNIDLSPRGIIERLDLLRPIYEETAAYGHFGRNEPNFSWEKTDIKELFARLK